jgi:hypothetical protein
MPLNRYQATAFLGIGLTTLDLGGQRHLPTLSIDMRGQVRYLAADLMN